MAPCGNAAFHGGNKFRNSKYEVDKRGRGLEQHDRHCGDDDLRLGNASKQRSQVRHDNTLECHHACCINAQLSACSWRGVDMLTPGRIETHPRLHLS